MRGVVRLLAVCAAVLLGPAPSARGAQCELPPSDNPTDFLVDTNAVYVPSRGRADGAVVGTDGTDYLVVWGDERSGEWDLYGARVSAEATVLDRAGFPIAVGQQAQWTGGVSFDGNNYLVVWKDHGSGNWDVYGARITQEGEVLDPGGFPIAVADHDCDDPGVSFDGTNYAVVWTDSRSGEEDVYCARVTPAGEVLDSMGFPVCTAGGQRNRAAICFDGTNYFVVWTDSRGTQSDIYGSRVTPAGEVLDPDGIAVSAGGGRQWEPVLSYDGVNYLVAWRDDYHVRAARVSAAGVVLDTTGLPVSPPGSDSRNPSTGFDGENYLVVWEDNRDIDGTKIFGARITPDGVLLDSVGFAISHDRPWPWWPRTVFGFDAYLVVWIQETDDVEQVFAGRVDTAGRLLDSTGFVLSTAASDQRGPAVAGLGDEYLVAWQDNRGDTADLYAARVDGSGRPLAPAFPVSIGEKRQRRPAIATDGSDYFVVWEDERDGYRAGTYATRVSASGVVLDTAGIPVGAMVDVGQYRPDVCFDGERYLVAWEDGRTGTSAIRTSRVTTDGQVLDPTGIPVPDSVDWACIEVAVDFDGTNYFLVYCDQRAGYYNIFCARMDSAGNVLDPDGIALSIVSAYQYDPDVACGDGQVLVVWYDHRNGVDNDIYAARVSQSGELLDTTAIAVCDAAGEQWHPAVYYDGSEYVVCWTDGRVNGEWQARGARVTADGAVADTFLLTDRPVSAGSALTPATGGQSLLVCSGWTEVDEGVDYNAFRIRAGVVAASGVRSSRGRVPVGSVLGHPNPFTRSVRLETGKAEAVRLDIFDACGRQVRTLAGHGGATWDGRDDHGRDLGPGVYLCLARGASGCVVSTRLVRIK